MKILLQVLCFLLITSYANILNAQFYVTGEPPASITWKKIETNHFKIVFPERMYQHANRYANLLEYYKQGSDLTQTNKIRKMPVLIHSSSVISNGYVTWTPKRMEIVATPPQDSYAQDWLSQLAIHEYRHVAQINGLNKGFTRILSFFTGQIAVGISSAMIPAWLYEGDAVYTETRLSNTGRGRLPGFEMPIRTLTIENSEPYCYDKSVFGSYKDFVPDHYHYGYQIVSYAQSRFGSELWPKAFEYTGKNMYLISPLAVYLKSNYSITKSKLYNMSMDSIKYLYNNSMEQIIYTKYSNIIVRNNKEYTNYTIPQFIKRNKIVALKSSIDHLDKLVIIDSTGHEQEIITTGLTWGNSLSASDRYIVWNESVRDIRWRRRDYSEIRILDLSTGKVRSLKKRTRYFSPVISADEKYIAAVETDPSNQNYLVLLDLVKGNVIKRIAVPENNALQTPHWTGTNSVVAIAVSDKGDKIVEINLKSEIWKTILPYTWHQVAEPLRYKNYIIFRGTYSGIDNIFAVNISTKNLFQVTSSRYGTRYPAINRDSTRLIYSDYTVKGFDIVEIPIDTSLWNPVETSERPSGIWFDEEDEVELNELYLNAPKQQYETKPFRKTLNFFGFHSWLPFYTDFSDNLNIEELKISPGVMLFSQNLLSTSILTMGYTFKQGVHILKPVLRWSGWYPVFEASAQFSSNSENSTVGDTDDFSNFVSNASYKLKTYLPLTFTRGEFIKQLQPCVEYQHTNTSYSVNGSTRKGIDYMHFRMYLSIYKRLSHRDLYPRLGSFLAISYTNTPLNKNQFGELYTLELNLFFPGIGAHHHLFINTGLQKQFLQDYYLPLNRLSFPRGYSSSVSRFLSVFAVNYAFPLFYPDLSIESILYVKRIKTNLFFDYLYGIDVVEYRQEGNIRYTGNYHSLGIELTADFHPLRFIFPISAGIRIGYMPLKKEEFIGFLININTGA